MFIKIAESNFNSPGMKFNIRGASIKKKAKMTVNSSQYSKNLMQPLRGSNRRFEKENYKQTN